MSTDLAPILHDIAEQEARILLQRDLIAALRKRRLGVEALKAQVVLQQLLTHLARLHRRAAVVQRSDFNLKVGGT